jgi:hypothetical protein
MRGVDLRWRSKRLAKDLAIDAPDDEGRREVTEVSRADRLGRAAAGADDTTRVRVLNAFEEELWNGRLQARRSELERIARIADRRDLPPAEREEKERRLRERLTWYLTFSPRLQPRGPWTSLAEAAGLPADPKAWTFKEENKGRQGDARLVLSRIPGIRVLSVDLGHRFGAACAVWRAVTTEELRTRCERAGVTPPRASDLHGRLVEGGRTAVLRRVGADELPDGSPHPAPWAVLERQFLVKLQGEEGPSRAATDDELAAIARFERDLGARWTVLDEIAAGPEARRPSGKARLEASRTRGFVLEASPAPLEATRRAPPRRILHLLQRALRTAELALRRHGDAARIAFAFGAESWPEAGGRMRRLSDEERTEKCAEALARWYDLASSRPAAGAHEVELWERHVAGLTGLPSARAEPQVAAESPRARRAHIESLVDRFRDAARRVLSSSTLLTTLREAWTARWTLDDGLPAMVRREGSRTVVVRPATGWYAHLRTLRGWIQPGPRVRGSERRRPGEGVGLGGLSLDRIALVRSLYRLLKAFRMRPRPDDLRRGVPEQGDSSLERFGERVLDAHERMRESRLKQLASRIVGSALGVAPPPPFSKSEEDPASRRRRLSRLERRFPPCHAVVVEDLERYRPDEVRTRRENRMLMSWSARNLAKRLEDACLLHGLKLWQVSARYTSQQDARTGAPGIRCRDVPVRELLHRSGALARRVARALEAVERGSRDAEARYLADLVQLWDPATRTWTEPARGGGARVVWRLETGGEWRALEGAPATREPLPVRLPQRGGDLFVSAEASSPAAHGLQADLNAAANIGLRALLDPDWAGRYWIVRCDPTTFVPAHTQVAGSHAFEPKRPLPVAAGGGSSPAAPAPPPARRSRPRRGEPSGGGQVRPVNLWRDPTWAGPYEGRWVGWDEYWNGVRARVIRSVLRPRAGLGRERDT